MDNEYDDILRVIESAGAEGAHPDTIRHHIAPKWGKDVMGSVMDLANQGYVFNVGGNFALKSKGRDLLKNGGFKRLAKRDSNAYFFSKWTFYIAIPILVFTIVGPCTCKKEFSATSNKPVDTTSPKSPHSSK